MNQPAPTHIRKPLAPPAHVSYAHKLGRGMLTFEQIDELVKPINSLYVQSKQGKSFLSQHQARAEMNRIFGYGNWSSRVLDMRLAYEERMHKDDNPKHPNFPGNGKSSVYWIACFEAHVEVEVRDLWGMPVTTFSEWHAEENAPQPNRGEARALAMTSVESYALRRALIGLGDRLGLGLYNGGSMAAHGQYSIQQYPGQLFEWQPINEQAIAAPVPQVVTHETIQAEPVISDDGTNPNWVDPSEQQQQQQQQPAPVQQSPHMQEFNQNQQVLQQAREQARQQAGAQPVQQMPQQPTYDPHQQQVAQQPAFDPSILAQVQQGFKVDQQGGQ